MTHKCTHCASPATIKAGDRHYCQKCWTRIFPHEAGGKGTMNANITIGDKYGPAMEIKEQGEADAYFAECVKHSVEKWGKPREEAESIERANLGYYAGYYDSATREGVERLFKCSHPVFGEISKASRPTPEKAINAGRATAQA